MGDYNIYQWVEKILTDADARELVGIYNRHTGSNLTLALLPFLNHDAAVRAVRAEKASITGNMPSPYTQSFNNHPVQKLLDKLDPEQYWVDMSTVGDRWRIEYNTVTEEKRALRPLEGFDDYDYTILGNVRKTL